LETFDTVWEKINEHHFDTNYNGHDWVKVRDKYRPRAAAAGDTKELRDVLQEMIDLFQTRVSTELNRFVRKVTAWGSIGIAWTVIVGLYGMNFTHMPEVGWRWGYPAVLVVMLLGSRTPVPYREIRAQFRAYRTAQEEAGLRAFERDKADLLELGVPLRYITPEDDESIEEAGYVVDLRRYRLPEIHLTPAEVAAQLGRSEGAVHMLCQRALLALREALGGGSSAFFSVKA
jgi:hypothetical protein